MREYFADFETFWSKHHGYTLKTMPQTLYLRDPRFEVLMLGIAEGDGPVSVHTGDEAIRAALAAVPWDEARVVSHNAMFDMAVLARVYGHRPRWIGDTLAHSRLAYPRITRHGLADMAEFLGLGVKRKDLDLMDGIDGDRLARAPRMLRQRLEGYCAVDTELCRGIDKALPALDPRDASAIDEGVRMTSEPILVLDGDTLDRLAEEGQQKASVHARLRSKQTFARELRGLGVTPETKPGKRGEQYAFARNDAFMLRMLGHENPKVRELAEARIEAQSNDELKRTTTLAAIARTGPLPAGIVPCKAHTGRDSGGERGNEDGVGSDKINLQNIKRASDLRKTIRAPEGWMLVVADSAQIEARTIAAEAGEDWVLEAFIAGRDVYAEFASRVYGFEVTKETHPDQRQIGKIAVLACGYKMGGRKFAETLRKDGVEMAELDAARIVNGYRRENRAIAAFWTFCESLIRDMTGRPRGEAPFLREAPGIVLGVSRHTLHLPSGRVIRYPNLANSERKRPERFDWSIQPAAGGRKKVYGGLVAENVTQAIARDILMLQAYRIRKRLAGMQARLVLRIHDELVYACPEAEVEPVVSVVEEEMQQGDRSWVDVPLAVEVQVAQAWGEAKG